MGRLFLSAAHKSSGKTTISLGLAAALTKRGMDVRPFKKGPDYIDPMWLANGAGAPCYNLDFHTQELDEIHALFDAKSAGGELALIEGNKGLHDGMDVEGVDSNAHLAKELDAPVVLVVDARGMTRGVAPLLLGMKQFDEAVNIAGVILNFVGGPRHEGKLRAVIERYTDIEVLGAVHRNDSISLTERHLGLTPSNEILEAREFIDAVAGVIEAEVDLDRILEIARAAKGLKAAQRAPTVPEPDIAIAVARGPAFGFYYPDDLEALQMAGARLVDFDPETATALPACDGLLVGGGFPEQRMAQLGANSALRADIKSAVHSGLPTYSECGGLMYLSRSISWNGEKADMVGLVPADAVMSERPQGRGYIVLKPETDFPWPGDLGQMDAIPAHEFHYSKLENLEKGQAFAYDVKRGQCINGRDGYIANNLIAGYAHMRSTARAPWAPAFAQFVRDKKNKV
ncbi:MAG: cobyrinate a,c-diamide synthase [Rhodospirillaceae bacterium]|nr:cobyrinate a,c-diamide synthase [Rhodospirillaceae bacterium]